MWATTCGCQPKHERLRLALRALTCLAIAESDNATAHYALGRARVIVLHKVGCGLAKRLLKHALVEVCVEESAIATEYFWREANHVWNSQPLSLH